MLVPLSVYLLSLLAFAFAYQRLRPGTRKKGRRLPFPPGPKPLPLIGNLADAPKDHPWLLYAEWGKKYGSNIVHADFLGSHVIVLNELDDVNELFEKRGAIYSDRPRMPLFKEVGGWGEWGVGVMDYNPWWRKLRATLIQYFTHSASEGYQNIQLVEVRRLLRRLLDTPDNFRHHVRHTTSAIVMRIVYGIEVQDTNDKYIDIAEKAMDDMKEALAPGGYIADLIPALARIPSWFPGASFKASAERWGVDGFALVNVPWEAVKDAMRKKETDLQPSVASDLITRLQDSQNPEEDDIVGRYSIANAYAAGSDTTSSAMASFFLAMILYPEVQKKAQAELDAVVGRDRLPDLSDKPNLPYIEALVKEDLRWQPTLPMSLPRRLMEDDEYRGFHMPKGATVLSNTWAILHDEKHYPRDPHSFRPDRFLKDGKLDATVLDPDIAFGYARRICPGRFVAANNLFIAFANILSCFDIEHARDDTGQIIPVEPAMIPSLLSHPEAFRCAIRPRHEGVPSLIQRSMEGGS